MLRRSLAVLVLALLPAACQHLRGHPSGAEALAAELLRMEAEDQAIRERTVTTPEELPAWEAEMTALSVRHTRRMQRILRRHGWPTRSLVGEEASRAAWLLVQHADHDPAFQRRVLALLEPLAERGEVRAVDVAYLRDRTHDPQRYGTQGRCVARGVWEPRPVEAPEEVDARRRAVGMVPETLSEYIRWMSGLCEAWPGEPETAG